MADEPKLVAIRFTDKQCPYNAGEVAGFALALAKNYVDRGVAVYHKADQALTLSIEETIPAGNQLPEEERVAARAADERQLAGESSQMSLESQPLKPESGQEDVGGSESAAGAGKKSGKR
jgi:hypothetical protein